MEEGNRKQGSDNYSGEISDFEVSVTLKKRTSNVPMKKTIHGNWW